MSAKPTPEFCRETILNLSHPFNLSYLEGCIVKLMLEGDNTDKDSRFAEASMLLQKYFMNSANTMRSCVSNPNPMTHAMCVTTIDPEPDWVSLDISCPQHLQMCSFLARGPNRMQTYYGIYLHAEKESLRIDGQADYGVFFDGKHAFCKEEVRAWKAMLREEKS